MKTPASRARIYSIIKTAEEADQDATRAETRAAVVQKQESAGKLPCGHVTSASLIEYATGLREAAKACIEDAAHIIATE